MRLILLQNKFLENFCFEGTISVVTDDDRAFGSRLALLLATRRHVLGTGPYGCRANAIREAHDGPEHGGDAAVRKGRRYWQRQTEMRQSLVDTFIQAV